MGCPGQHTSHPSRGRMARMKRGLKLGFGIPLVLLGLFITIGGIAVVVLVGTDGSFTLPQTQGDSSGHALVFETLDLSEALPSSGSFAATVGVTVTGNGADGDVFVGIGRAADVARYLDHVQVDRIVQVNWPGRSEERRVGKECRSRWSPY